MHTQNTSFILSMGLLTALTLAVSIVVLFELPALLFGEPQSPHGLRDYVTIILLVVTLLLGIGALGGGLWGLGIAAFMRVDGRPLARRGAYSWGGTLLVAGLLLYFSQIPIAAIDRQLQLSIHILFTAAFVPVVAAAAAANTYMITGKLDTGGIQTSAAKNAGLAAGLGFLLMSLALFLGFGWEVGRPQTYRNINMITIMHFCNFGACLAGGAALSWTISRHTVLPSKEDSPALPAKGKDVII